MTWLTTFYLRAFVVLVQVALVYSDGNGPKPGFKQQPKNTIIESENQTILCDIKGEKPLKVFWSKNGNILYLKKHKYLSISSEGSLNIFNTQRKRDEGSYRCIVENKFGRVLSRKAVVTFPYMNEFSVHDMRVTVSEGDKAYLACHAPDSYPDRNIFWSKVNARRTGSFPLQLESKSHFANSEEGNLYFSYTTRSDSGVYYCSVENNNLRRILRRTVVLEVSGKVTQKNVQPKVWLFDDKFAMKDSNFMLECISYGSPMPVMRFRHLKTGSLLTESRRVGNRLTYEFGKFEEQHEGDYACEVSNVYGNKDSKTATIKMEAKPYLLTKSHAKSVAVDSPVTLPCIAYGIPSVNYQWYFNGQLITNMHGIVSHKGNLTISKVMKHHEGFYQCFAYNRHGEVLMTTHFTVVELPAGFGPFSKPPAKTTHALIGGSAEINCIPSGAPTPTVRWRKQNSTRDIVVLDERFTTLTTGTLKITNIKKSDEGSYECIASNKLRTVKETGKLIVTGGLAITKPLTKQDEITVGRKIKLTCTISSVEQMEVVFRWYLGSRTYKRRLHNRGRIRITKLNSRQSQIEIDTAKTEDTGNYMCQVLGTKNRSDVRSQLIIVTGPNGHEVPDLSQGPSGIKTTAVANKKSTELIVKGPPEPPLDVTATEMSGTNIKISWTMNRDNGEKAKRVYIQGRTTFDINNWETIKISNKTIKPRESEIVHLSPWVEYKIRVIAENANGKSKPSIEIDKWIRTPTAKPEKYPSNIKGNGTGPNEFTISFDPLPEIDQNAPGIAYIVYHREKYSSYSMVSHTVPKDQNYITLTFRSSDSYYKLYEFQVQAKNEKGLGPKSPVYTAFSGERTPLGVPKNLRVRITSSISADATWDDVSKSRSSIRGKFLGYKFLYWKKPNPDYPQVEQYVSVYVNKVTVKLMPHTEYMFQVLAFNSAGDGPTSNTVGPLMTPEGKPRKPANFKVMEATGGEATITWNEPLYKNGILTQYVLKYHSLPDGHVYEKDLNVDERMVVLSNLSPNGVYLFKLAAVTIAGTGEHASVEFDFSKVPQIKPETPIVASVGHNAIVLTWSPVPYTNISGYKVFYWAFGDAQSKAIALWERRDDIVTTVHSLKPNTKYYFQIAVVNQYGTGPRSHTVEARTKPGHGSVTTPAKPKIAGKRSRSFKLKLSNYVIILLTLVAVLVPR